MNLETFNWLLTKAGQALLAEAMAAVRPQAAAHPPARDAGAITVKKRGSPLDTGALAPARRHRNRPQIWWMRRFHADNFLKLSVRFGLIRADRRSIPQGLPEMAPANSRVCEAQ